MRRPLSGFVRSQTERVPDGINVNDEGAPWLFYRIAEPACTQLCGSLARRVQVVDRQVEVHLLWNTIGPLGRLVGGDLLERELQRQVFDADLAPLVVAG